MLRNCWFNTGVKFSAVGDAVAANRLNTASAEDAQPEVPRQPPLQDEPRQHQRRPLRTPRERHQRAVELQRGGNRQEDKGNRKRDEGHMRRCARPLPGGIRRQPVEDG